MLLHVPVCTKITDCFTELYSHPGPSNNVGRSAPELDVFEALVNTGSFYGEISQSGSSYAIGHTLGSLPLFWYTALQMAPFDMDYTWPNASGTYTVGHRWDTELNEYKGGIFQQVSLSLALCQVRHSRGAQLTVTSCLSTISPSRHCLERIKNHTISKTGDHSRPTRTNTCPAQARIPMVMHTGCR